MRHLQKEFEKVCWAHLMEIAGNDKHRVSLDIGGPGLVVTEAGPAGGWYVSVGIEHDVLLDQPIVVSTIPVASIRPLPDDLKQATELVFSDAKAERDKMSHPQVPVALQQKFGEAVPLSERPGPKLEDRPKAPPRERVSHFKSDPTTKDDIGSKSDVV